MLKIDFFSGGHKNIPIVATAYITNARYPLSFPNPATSRHWTHDIAYMPWLPLIYGKIFYRVH